MKTRTYTILATALAASMTLLGACGSDSTPPVTTVTDSGTSSGGDSAGDNDAGGTQDSVSGTDSGSSSGSQDVGTTPQDTGPSKPAKCKLTDQACIASCSAKQCSNEEKACSSAPKCEGFVKCIGGCANGQDPPGDPKGATCPEKCRNIAGKDAVNLYLSLSSCTLSECVEVKKCESTMPQQQLAQCANVCVQARCFLPSQECEGDKACAWINKCFVECQQGKTPPWPPADHKPNPAFLPGGVTPTGAGECTGKCYGSVPFETSRRFLASVICLQSQCLKQPYTVPCKTPKCANACALDKCDKNFAQCIDDTACSALFTCLTVKQCGQNASCQTACQKYLVDTYGGSDANSALQTYNSISGCASQQCVGGF